MVNLEPLSKYLVVGPPNSGKTTFISKFVLDSLFKVLVLGEIWNKVLNWEDSDSVLLEFYKTIYSELEFLMFAHMDKNSIWFVENGSFVFLYAPIKFRSLAISLVSENLLRYDGVVFLDNKNPTFYSAKNFILKLNSMLFSQEIQ